MQKLDKEHWQGRWSEPLVRATLPALPPVHSHLQYSPYPPRMHRPRLTATLWEDESTLCYQVDTRGICVARRQGNIKGHVSHVMLMSLFRQQHD